MCWLIGVGLPRVGLTRRGKARVGKARCESVFATRMLSNDFSGTQKLTFSEDYFIKIAFAIFAVLNLVSFLTYWFDKRRAGTGKDRISESKLLQLSFLGPVGSVPGIWWVRHKTKKVSYLVKYFAVLTLSIAAHIAIGYFWFRGGQ